MSFTVKMTNPLVDLDGPAELAGAESEESLMQIGRIAQRDGIGHGDRSGFAHFEMEFLGEVVERLPVRLADGGGHLVRDVVGLGADLLIEDRLKDGVANFVEGLGVGRFAVENLDDVETVLRFHQIRNRALRQAEGRLLKFGHRLAVDDPAEVAALRLRASSSEYFLARSSKLAPFWACFRTSSAFW